jgi:hypothetical protein
MRKKVEVGSYYDKVQDKDVSCLIINGETLTWGVTPDSLTRAKEAWKSDPTIRDSVMMDIHHHFLKAFCKAVGKTVTIRDVNEAINAGYIDV